MVSVTPSKLPQTLPASFSVDQIGVMVPVGEFALAWSVSLTLRGHGWDIRLEQQSFAYVTCSTRILHRIVNKDLSMSTK